jgi:4-amino-4-deoxy-L-arabinose transferase-like glycosyltransferase
MKNFQLFKQVLRLEYAPVLLLLVGFVLFSSGLGLRDPWPPDEPRFALIAKQMVESGDWLFPHRGNELYPDKPPFFMWSIAAFYTLTGSITWSFLLPSLIAGLITLLLVYDLGRRMWGRQIGLIAGLTLLATFQFTVQVKLAQIDAMLCMWITLGIYGLLRHLILGPAWGWYYGSFVAMGFGILTKIIGFFPAAMLVPYIYAHWRGWHGIARFDYKWWQWLLGPVLMVVAAGVWLVPMLIHVAMSQDPALIEYRNDLLFKQTKDRYLDSWTHVRPFYYYVVNVIPVFWLPVTLALPWLVPAWYRRLHRFDARYLILLSWIVMIVTFFSMSPGKRGVYMLPMVPVLALAVAPLVPGLVKKVNVQRTFFIGLLVLGTGIILAVLFFTVFQPERGAELVEKYNASPWLFLSVLGATALLITAVARARRGVLAFVSFFFVLWLYYGWWGYPLMNPVRSFAPLMAQAGKIIGPDAELGLVKWREQTLLFADRQVKTFGFLYASREEQLQRGIAWLRQQDNRWLLLPDLSRADCFRKEDARDLGWMDRQEWYLVNKKALIKDCVPRSVE